MELQRRKLSDTCRKIQHQLSIEEDNRSVGYCSLNTFNHSLIIDEQSQCWWYSSSWHLYIIKSFIVESTSDSKLKKNISSIFCQVNGTKMDCCCPLYCWYKCLHCEVYIQILAVVDQLLQLKGIHTFNEKACLCLLNIIACSYSNWLLLLIIALCFN